MTEHFIAPLHLRVLESLWAEGDFYAFFLIAFGASSCEHDGEDWIGGNK